MDDLLKNIEAATDKLVELQKLRDEAEAEKNLHEATAKQIRKESDQARAEANTKACEHEELSRMAGLRYQNYKKDIVTVQTALNSHRVQQKVLTAEQAAAKALTEAQAVAAKSREEANAVVAQAKADAQAAKTEQDAALAKLTAKQVELEALIAKATAATANPG